MYVISQAINERKLLSFSYVNSKGQSSQKIVEPLALGVSKAGNSVLRGHIVGGNTNTSTMDSYPLFKVSNMSGVRVMDKSFTAPSAGGDRGMISITTSV